jgi:hypothetical protein
MHIKLSDLFEGKFKERKNQIHLFDAPMFSVYADTNLPKKDMYNIKRGEKRIKTAFENARQQIHSMGFASMHANVLIKDLSGETNVNTSKIGDVGGYAHSKGKYMELSSRIFGSGKMESLTKTIVHEWAHLWMFNNSKEFKNSVNTLYNKLVSSGAERIKPEDVKSKIEFSNEEYKVIINEWVQTLVKLITRNNTFKVFASKNMPSADVAPPSSDNTITDATEQDLQNEVVQKMKAGIIKICSDNNLEQPSAETMDNVEEMANKYVYPKLLLLAQDPEVYKDATKSIDSIYDYLWMSNDLKPKGVSIMDTLKPLKTPAAIKKVKGEFSSSLSGKDYEFHRKYLKNIHNWVNDYGMSNNQELWATGIEEFFKLPLPHRKAVIKLMMNMGAS